MSARWRLGAVVRVTALAVLAVGAAAPTAVADQRDPRLGDLFVQLKSAPSQEAAAILEGQIWGIWLQSGNAAVDALMETGVQRLNEGDLDAALDAFSKTVALAPDFAEGWNKRATVLYLLDRFADSMLDIAHVLSLEPRHFGALSGLGLCNARLDKEQAALDAFERAIAIDPNLHNVARNIEALKQSIARHSI